MKHIFLPLNLTCLIGRSCNNRERKWQCTDVEIQRLILRSMDAFLDSITNETSHHPLVKVLNNIKMHGYNIWRRTMII